MSVGTVAWRGALGGVALLGMLPGAASAQGAESLENRTAWEVGVRGGGWVGGYDDAWPSLAASLDWRLEERFVVDAGYAAVWRPEVLCSGFQEGQEPGECDDLEAIHVATVGFRAELGSARLRPYLGVFGGSTWYHDRGAILGARGGLRYPISERVSAVADVAVQMLGERGSVGGYTALTFGASVRL